MLQCKKTSKFTRHEQVGKDGLRTNYLNTGNNVSQISASVHLSCCYDSQNSEYYQFTGYSTLCNYYFGDLGHLVTSGGFSAANKMQKLCLMMNK